MQRTILLLSRDPSLSFTRAQILERAGYQTASAVDVALGLALAAHMRPSLAIVGHSFSDLEQEAFVESIQEAHPGICVLLLRFGLLHPTQLLSECEACFAQQPGRSIVRIVEPALAGQALSGLSSSAETNSERRLESSPRRHQETTLS